MPDPSRVALLSMEPGIVGNDYTPFSYGVRRLQAALLDDPRLSDVEVHLVESQSRDPEAWVAEVEACDAGVVGFSTYTWSFATFLEVARRLKRAQPGRVIVLGGPSARPAMFALPPWRAAVADVDALVVTDGELIFRDLVHARPRGREDLREVPGLHISSAGGFVATAPAPELMQLDALPSPARMGLIHGGRTVPLETYRGCPLSCAFCQWGDLNRPDRIFSEEYLVAELTALRDAGAPSAQLVDAALNLNSRAFRNLASAERQVGLFREAILFACVYPTYLTEQHLEFLSGVPRACLDVGLQSFNKETLDTNQRPFKESRFGQVIEDLSRLAQVEVEVILGLPGDSPEAFRKTVERARELPCKVRVFHCLVLPDALMTRAAPSSAMTFDPLTLRMQSCLGWSEEALAKERAWLVEEVGRVDGEIAADMWSFPAPKYAQERAAARAASARTASARTTGARAASARAASVKTASVKTASVKTASVGTARVVAQSEPGSEALRDVREKVSSVLREVTGGLWSLVEISTITDGKARLTLTVKTREASVVVEATPATTMPRAYKVIDGVAFTYRMAAGGRLSDGAGRLLDRVLRRLHGSAREVLGLGAAEVDADNASRVGDANGAGGKGAEAHGAAPVDTSAVSSSPAVPAVKAVRRLPVAP
ncbi:B12-binding domain-containing radical SAM protein [Chondromyces apiculatus]|uniref:Uncharacterized protein n=1 Tax=Chondromyces apiculatus DSM 436 TaxID=1192034 RepID=A0A017SYR0_9BACT|nr:cobalamin-dependent protein [Chondromyces apiculatus]EYF01760.1 Hypothetical protein CAP_7826 [Chondromyces apiculatus DSM 436]